MNGASLAARVAAELRRLRSASRGSRGAGTGAIAHSLHARVSAAGGPGQRRIAGDAAAAARAASARAAAQRSRP